MYVIYDKKSNQLKCEPCEYTCFETTSVIVLYDGIPSPFFHEMLDHANANVDWMRAFAGPFLLLLYIKESGDLILTQHLFGNGKNLYFKENDNTIYLASSLQELRHILNQPFRLNVAMLPHYFYNGFLANAHTLVAGVYKLEAATSYIIKNGKIQKNKIKFNEDSKDNEDEISSGLLTSGYEEALSNSIQLLASMAGKTKALALSGGYDSNCLLYKLRQLFPDKEIRAFSVGGVIGVDETETAFKIANQYDNVSFYKSLVSPKTLEHLDEIVAILEGSVYERGIFLQFELSRLLQKHEVTHLICGECADQVFHVNTYEDIPEATFLYGYRETPLQMAVYAVLKKSRMMLEAHGIQGLYPFLNPEMVRIGFETRKINGITKEFHKTQCRNMLPDPVIEMIGKQGGSTDLSTLFPDDFDCAEMKKCKYYSEDFILTQKYNHEEALRDYYLSLLFLESFEKQFCD